MGMNTAAVQRLYVAYFNRPADPVSLAVYEGLLPSDTVATQAELLVVAETYFSPSAEYTSNFTGKSNSQIVDQLYQNIFGRPAEAAGLLDWATKLTDGSMTVAELALQLSFSAQGTDKTVVDARIEAATTFTDGLNTAEEITGYSGDAAAAEGRTYLAQISGALPTTEAAITTQKDTAITNVNASISAAVDAGNAVAGSTFQLTTAADTFTGGAGNDTFRGSIDDNTAANNTFTLLDTLAGAGGDDTMYITGDVSAGGIALPAANVSGIENYLVRNVSGQTLTFNAALVSGETKIVSDRSTAQLTLTNVSAGTTLEVNGDAATTNGGFTAGYANTATAGVLNITNGTTAGAIAVNGAGMTTMAISSTGAANTVGTVASTGTMASTTIAATTNLTMTSLAVGTNAAAQSLTITGAGAVSMGALDADFATINGAGNSGGITATLSATTTATFTGGTGNDVITTSTNAQTGAVNAGDGTDTLVIANAVDVNSAAEGAIYTNFETVSSAVSVNLALLTGIEALQISGGTSETYSGVTQTIANNVTFTGNNATSTIFTGTNVTGTSDSLTINLSSATATTNVDVVGISAIGYETVNINATTGTDGTLSDFGFLANSGDNVSSVVITGSADVQLNAVANTFDVVPVSINASGLTGTGHFVLATGVLLSGSSVTATGNADTVAISSTTGTTYTMGGGNDSLTGSLADLVATGSDDNIIRGGDGVDTITLDDTAVTLTDNHFTNLSGMEALTVNASTGATSITTGGSFNAAFANGATITQNAHADGTAVSYVMGLSNVDTTIALTTAAIANAAGENITITTGSGADTVTVVAAGFIGNGAGASSVMAINTAAGNDAITFSYGTMVANSTAGGVTIDAGTGQDTITKTAGTNDGTAIGITTYTVQDGDSLAASFDTISGFDLGTGTTFADSLDFGTANVEGNTAGTDGTDSGTIKSHAITSGIVTFDDTDVFATAVVVNAGNISDVLAYLATNISTAGDTVALAYDSTGNGTADSTFVFNQGTLDSVVLLAGVVGTSLSATNAATGGLIDIG
ncbi:DUF4214 domain-containing protein [Luminiphilus sp.]|nr:DUF4214 domain-containing protein [Luminiphilus sp.]